MFKLKVVYILSSKAVRATYKDPIEKKEREGGEKKERKEGREGGGKEEGKEGEEKQEKGMKKGWMDFLACHGGTHM